MSDGFLLSKWPAFGQYELQCWLYSDNQKEKNLNETNLYKTIQLNRNTKLKEWLHFATVAPQAAEKIRKC